MWQLLTWDMQPVVNLFANFVSERGIYSFFALPLPLSLCLCLHLCLPNSHRPCSILRLPLSLPRSLAPSLPPLHNSFTFSTVLSPDLLPLSFIATDHWCCIISIQSLSVSSVVFFKINSLFARTNPLCSPVPTEA